MELEAYILTYTDRALQSGRLAGCSGGSVVEHLPLAQGVIPGSWDGVLHQAAFREPASPSASLCLS